jgi:hypothetical protein
LQFAAALFTQRLMKYPIAPIANIVPIMANLLSAYCISQFRACSQSCREVISLKVGVACVSSSNAIVIPALTCISTTTGVGFYSIALVVYIKIA